MQSGKWWFKLTLAVVLAAFVATSVLPALAPPAYAQGVFSRKREGASDDEQKKKEEQEQKEEREKAERERQERAERERQAREQAEREKQAREQAERDRLVSERAEQERQAREAKERAQREQAEIERLQREQQERERLAREQAERERQAREQAELDRLAREQAERDRQAKEQAERDKINAEKAAAANQAGVEPVQQIEKPIPRVGPPRSGSKFTRLEERPGHEERRDPQRYRPPSYYPYDSGYRSEPPTRYPAPLPPELPSSPDDPEVIVIERWPTDKPEPQPPPEPEVESPETPLPSPEQPDAETQAPDAQKPQPPEVKRQAHIPVIPEKLMLPVEAGTSLEALNHICLAWLTRDLGLIRRHVNPSTPVRIYKKGKLSHKLRGREFLEMTADALKRMETREFRLRPVSTRYGKVFAMGSHVYTGLDGEFQRMLLNYTLKKVRGVWTIVEVGFSPGTMVTARRHVR